jgi:hypothetical protein
LLADGGTTARRGLGIAQAGTQLIQPREKDGVEMSEAFSESEIETLHKGAMGAGLLVSASDRGFFDTFKEAGALAKHVAAARGTGFGLASSPGEIESGTLDALRASLALLEAKAPEEVDAYRSFVLGLARSVAAAAPGGDEAETGAIAKIEAALRGGDAAAS